MYEIITTPAFVLSASPQGDADLYIKVYTRELGLIGAVASGARKETSKHRFSVQPFSFISLSIVQGKHGYRVTGAEHEQHTCLGKDDEIKQTIGKISKLLTVLIHGSEKDQELFDFMQELFTYICTSHLDSETANQYEIYTVIRIVKHLGYFDESQIPDIPETFFEKNLPDKLSLEHIQKNQHSYIQYINKSIFESQL